MSSELNTRNIKAVAEGLKIERAKVYKLEIELANLRSLVGDLQSNNIRMMQEVNIMKAKSMGTGPTG